MIWHNKWNHSTQCLTSLQLIPVCFQQNDIRGTLILQLKYKTHNTSIHNHSIKWSLNKKSFVWVSLWGDIVPPAWYVHWSYHSPLVGAVSNSPAIWPHRSVATFLPGEPGLALYVLTPRFLPLHKYWFPSYKLPSDLTLCSVPSQVCHRKSERTKV